MPPTSITARESFVTKTQASSDFWIGYSSSRKDHFSVEAAADSFLRLEVLTNWYVNEPAKDKPKPNRGFNHVGSRKKPIFSNTKNKKVMVLAPYKNAATIVKVSIRLDISIINSVPLIKIKAAV